MKIEKAIERAKAKRGRKAFEKAFEILGAGVEKDEEATTRAGCQSRTSSRSAKNPRRGRLCAAALV